MRINHLLTNGGRAAANQFVVINDNVATMVSYDTPVSQVVKGREPLAFVGDAWDYSRTTCKYVVQFFRVYGSWRNSNDIRKKADIDKLISAGEIEEKDLAL